MSTSLNGISESPLSDCEVIEGKGCEGKGGGRKEHEVMRVV